LSETLSWGAAIVAGGADCKLTFYNETTAAPQTFDYGGDENVREFASAAFNPAGEALAGRPGGINGYSGEISQWVPS